MKKLLNILNVFRYKRLYLELTERIENKIQKIEKEKETNEKYKCYSDLTKNIHDLNLLKEMLGKEKENE